MINFKHKKYYRPDPDEEYFLKTEKYLDEYCQFCERTGLWMNLKTEEVVCSHCNEIQEDE